MDEDETHLSATEARAGRTTHSVRYILGISLVAIVVIFGILVIMYR